MTPPFATLASMTGKTPSRLTGADREIMRRADLLPDVSLIDGLREHTGEQDETQAFIDGWEEAMHLLREQAAIIRRLAGEDGKDGSDDAR